MRSYEKLLLASEMDSTAQKIELLSWTFGKEEQSFFLSLASNEIRTWPEYRAAVL